MMAKNYQTTCFFMLNSHLHSLASVKGLIMYFLAFKLHSILYSQSMRKLPDPAIRQIFICPAENFSLSDKYPATLRKSQILITGYI